MRRFTLAVVLAAILPCAAAQAQVADTTPCGTTHKHNWLAKQAYRYSHHNDNYVALRVRANYRLRMAQMRSCAKHTAQPNKYRAMVRYYRHRKGKWETFRYIDAITPFGKWAIPPAIVYCESGGSWTAANPSGARGPYQLLGHGEPWPVRTLNDKIRHHLIARSLYISGGTGPWVSSRFCWG